MIDMIQQHVIPSMRKAGFYDITQLQISVDTLKKVSLVQGELRRREEKMRAASLQQHFTEPSSYRHSTT
jgi:hypothetical protein